MIFFMRVLLVIGSVKVKKVQLAISIYAPHYRGLSATLQIGKVGWAGEGVSPRFNCRFWIVVVG
jgi:hypothetical protein